MTALSLLSILAAALTAAAISISSTGLSGILYHHEDCTNTPTSCAPGLIYTGLTSHKKCVFDPTAGGSCRHKPSNCPDNKICENDVCKLGWHGNCTNDRTACATGLVCDGAHSEKRCMTRRPAGMTCGPSSSFSLCEDDLTCENETCKIPLGGFCTNAVGQCGHGLVCGGVAGQQRCVARRAAGMSCCARDVFSVCEPGLLCEKNVCKLRRTLECTGREGLCQRGLACDGRGFVKRCIRYRVAGMACKRHRHFSICRAGLVCESEVCRIPIGTRCMGEWANCVDGAKCGRVGRRSVCVPI